MAKLGKPGPDGEVLGNPGAHIPDLKADCNGTLVEATHPTKLSPK